MGKDGVLEVWCADMLTRMECDDYTFSSMGDGLQYPLTWLRTRHNWKDQWQVAVKFKMRMLFILLIIYEDDFVRSLNSRVSQTIFQITPG